MNWHADIIGRYELITDKLVSATRKASYHRSGISVEY